jgi:hypothetical protein
MACWNPAALLGTAALGLAVLTGACRSNRTETARPEMEGTVSVCHVCYAKAVEVWDNGNWAGPQFGYVRAPQVHEEYECADCHAKATVHTEDGQWIITCPTCAPEGVPAQQCEPSERAST